MSTAPAILTLSCPDTTGIVATISGLLAELGCNIVGSKQYSDPQTELFFMRVTFSPPQDWAILREGIARIAERFAMQWQLYDSGCRPKVMVLVSQHGHCLNDLLYRYRIGALPMDLRAIVSNHRNFYQLAASHDIPFHYLPVNAATRERQEARLLEIVDDEQVELVILARYMQILSPTLCQRLEGRVINIHHSFLPSFKGARPYHQAHARGVKLIGATAHFVTEDLDEGPIIDQEAAKVDHAMTVEDFIAVGRDIENVVLSRAVKAYLERRVLLDRHKTVVF